MKNNNDNDKNVDNNNDDDDINEKTTMTLIMTATKKNDNNNDVNNDGDEKNDNNNDVNSNNDGDDDKNDRNNYNRTLNLPVPFLVVCNKTLLFYFQNNNAMKEVDHTSLLSFLNSSKVLTRDIDGSLTRRDLSIDETIAHILSLLSEMYTTTSSIIQFLLYELAMNPDCQEKLLDEVNSLFAKVRIETFTNNTSPLLFYYCLTLWFFFFFLRK